MANGGEVTVLFCGDGATVKVGTDNRRSWIRAARKRRRRRTENLSLILLLLIPCTRMNFKVFSLGSFLKIMKESK